MRRTKEEIEYLISRSPISRFRFIFPFLSKKHGSLKINIFLFLCNGSCMYKYILLYLQTDIERNNFFLSLKEKINLLVSYN